MTRRLLLACIVATSVAFVQRPVVAQQERPNRVGAANVPVFRLNGPLTESPAAEGIPLFGPPTTSLKDLLERMNKASKDPSVKAVIILAERLGAGPGQVEEIRQAIGEIREAGKDVYVHADSVSMTDYILLCAASRLSVTPTADLWLNGIHAESPYVRGLLDKIGVQPDFLAMGDYKSAAEVFTRTGPSPQSDEMMNWLLDSMFDSWVRQIAQSRKMEPDKVRKLIDAGLYSAEKAKEAGLVDAVEHRQDFESMLREKLGGDAPMAVTFDSAYGVPQQPKLDLSPMGLMKMMMGGALGGGPQEAKPQGPAIAIVYVDGIIVPGSRQPSPLAGGGLATSTDVRTALDRAAEDASVKAVVLRINSPGGSPVASEIILDATKRVKAKKPFAVSMGDVAGSGGYYVACGGDTIFADETTLTGSIGVVAGKLVTSDMWGKVGITFKDYNRGKNADLLSSSKPLSDEQRKQFEAWMNEVYGVFKNHVTAARGKKLKKPIDEIAGGRVYTGRQAVELGLVDQIGTLTDAIRHVAKQANVQNYTLRTYPEAENFLDTLMESLTGEEKADDSRHLMTGGLGVRTFQPSAVPGTSISELALPYLQQLDPQRVSSVRTALQRLDLLREESVIVTMPEIVVKQ